jgi:hypothetical protein
MTVKSLFSFMKSHQPNESVEQGLLISRRLKELLEIAEVPTSGTPEGNGSACSSKADQCLQQ